MIRSDIEARRVEIKWLTDCWGIQDTTSEGRLRFVVVFGDENQYIYTRQRYATFKEAATSIIEDKRLFDKSTIESLRREVERLEEQNAMLHRHVRWHGSV